MEHVFELITLGNLLGLVLWELFFLTMEEVLLKFLFDQCGHVFPAYVSLIVFGVRRFVTVFVVGVGRHLRTAQKE